MSMLSRFIGTVGIDDVFVTSVKSTKQKIAAGRFFVCVRRHLIFLILYSILGRIDVGA